VIIGSLGRWWRPMYCKLGHRVEKIVSIEATNALERSSVANMMLIWVVPGETNKRIKGVNPAVVDDNSRVFRFGSKGSFKSKRCKTNNTPGDRLPREPMSLNFRILRAYFRKVANSSVVGSLLKYFRVKWLREETT
jgi:hypothetical protein